ncbi:hypothetical protein [Parasitella parasitica]|uniref:Reverse transcriptase domain-containing protein n=1 Tax=Parasitella parasitica TaxID=35722 RepID=A0A0B7NLC7_9FUNG|nr:hypothetical protein [Parasitella parasitica]
MSTLEEQVFALQQQLASLQAQIQTASGPTPMQSVDDTARPTPMQQGENAAMPPLHSFGTRPHYDWSPSDALMDLMELDTPIHHAKALPDSERKAIIEAYPPMAHLDYRAPATIPTAERMMNRGQKYEDTAIKQLQYLLSAAFRPLDILIHEMFTHENGNPNLERYSTMLRDIRRLLLHVCSMMTQQPRKATREATVNRKQRRFNRSSSNSGSSSNGSDPSFFRSGPPSQQGGSNNNSNTNYSNNNTYSHNNNHSNNANSDNSNNLQRNNKKNANPFRHKYYQQWKNITNNSFVINTIQHGYHIPFLTTPPTTTTPTSITPFSVEQATLIDQAIQDLLAKSAIEKVSPQQVQQTPGFYSSMFVIPKKNGGVRPVFNLKRLNQYLEAPHFKMETLREVSLMIKPNDYLVSIDLSDAFLHVGLHPESRRFLRLKWRNQVYQYCTTAFGLSSSPFVFTKVCRPILEHLRSRGFRISAYLDDWLLIANSKQQAETQARQVVSLLEDLGWIINYKKSVLTPTQQLEHLGFVLNTRSMTALLPASKLRDIRRSIKQVLTKPHRQSPRVIHSLTMRIQAATFAIFPARLYTRHLLFYKNQTVKSDTDWDQPRPLDQASMEELQWWYQNINKWNGRSLLPSTPNQTIFVDASNTGWGCSWNHHRAHGYWTAEEAAQSINWRELKAAQLALKTFHPPPNSTVLIRTDNTTSLTYINKQGGTRSLPLLELATEVWTWCLRHKIMIQAQHIQGLHNKIADFESRRQFFKNQWMIKPPDNEVVTKLRVMDAGSRSSLYGCSLDSMDQLPESLRKSSLESYIAGIAQDQAGTSTFGDSGGTILAQCSLVPSGSTDGSLSPMDADTTSGADNISSDVASSLVHTMKLLKT